MTRIRTTITIDENLLKNAKHHKIRISTFLHNSLQDYLGKINGSKSLDMAEVLSSNLNEPILPSVKVLSFCAKFSIDANLSSVSSHAK